MSPTGSSEPSKVQEIPSRLPPATGNLVEDSITVHQTFRCDSDELTEFRARDMSQTFPVPGMLSYPELRAALVWVPSEA